MHHLLRKSVDDASIWDDRSANIIIKNARKLLGMTKKEFADRMGVSVRHISKIEANETHPTMALVLQCLRSVGLDLDYHTVKRDDSDWILGRQVLQRNKEERIEWNANMLRQREKFQGIASHG